MNKKLRKFICSLIHVNKLTPVDDQRVWYCNKCGIKFKYSTGTTNTGPR